MTDLLTKIRKAPKVLLHDHLDGGVRSRTVIELAEEQKYNKLPTKNPDDLAAWFVRGAAKGDLRLYLEPFQHTVGVTQNAEALRRVSFEAVEDLAADGIVYAEIRFAPELHTEAGLSLDEVMEAVCQGVAESERTLKAKGTPIVARILCTAMRTAARSLEIAQLAIKFRNRGVVGFDIAGAEAGHPPSRHLDAFQLCMRENFHITIHAGEAFGLPSIAEALHYCGAERLGHGVRIIDDIDTSGEIAKLGLLANYVRDRRIPLEMCPTSNVNTGAAFSIAKHPIDVLKKLKFRICVNTDNRLMSNVSLSDEFIKLHKAFNYGLADMRWLTMNAMKSSFLSFDERLEIVNSIIKPGYANLCDS